MDQIHEDLIAVINRLPEHAYVLKKYFQSNQKFRNMCEDYRKCHDALTYWTQSQKEGSREPRKEYAELLAELEAEIIEFLDGHS